MTKKIILKVNKHKLINWYFDNWDRHESYLFVNDVRGEIISSGKYVLTVEEIADRLGYLPSHILEGTHNVSEYEVWDELILI